MITADGDMDAATKHKELKRVAGTIGATAGKVLRGAIGGILGVVVGVPSVS